MRGPPARMVALSTTLNNLGLLYYRMARYAESGVGTVLVTCTGGEEGDILNDELDHPHIRENLAEVRRQETHAGFEARFREAHDAIGSGDYDAVILTEMVELRDAIRYHDSARALVDWAGKTPDREFLLQPVNGEIRTHTFAESEDAARRLANALIGMGLNPGDKVAILAMLIRPLADAGLDISIVEGEAAILDGTNSSDTDGTIISYLWEQDEGDPVRVGIDSPATANPTINFQMVGDKNGESYTFWLTVTDNEWNLPDTGTAYKPYRDKVIVNVLGTWREWHAITIGAAR